MSVVAKQVVPTRAVVVARNRMGVVLLIYQTVAFVSMTHRPFHVSHTAQLPRGCAAWWYVGAGIKREMVAKLSQQFGNDIGHDEARGAW
jgi:hypothetical protein